MVNDRHCFLANMERRILVLFFSSSSMVGMAGGFDRAASSRR